jgi:hypothetical protein
LDGGSASHKAAPYTQGNISTKYTQGITASKGIRTRDPGVSAPKTVHSSDQAATVIGNRKVTVGVRVGVKLFLRLTKHHARMPYGAVDREIQALLTPPPVGGEWSAPSAGRFTPGSSSRYPLYRGFVGPHRAGPNDMEK